MHYAGVVRTFSVTSFSIIKRDMLRQILLQLFFILAKKNLCTFLLWGHTTRSTKSENLMPCHENNMVLYILKHYYRPKGYIFYQLV